MDKSPDVANDMKKEYEKLKLEGKTETEIDLLLKERFNCTCFHRYLNKWDDVYVCMDCFYRLTIEKDVARIAAEEDREKNTPSDVIPAGKDVGQMSQQRGVSIGFLLKFTNKYNCWKWNSWDVIKKIIKPATEETRCRYVELPEMAVHVGPADSFISYAQAGLWGDLVGAVADKADPSRKVWIDVFAVRQWPSSTPDLDFGSTIRNCSSFIVVCSNLKEVENIGYNNILSRNTKALPPSVPKQISFLRVWCLVEVHTAAMMPTMPLIMKVGSHQLLDDGSVSFMSSSEELISILSYLVDIDQAEATVVSDKEHILSSIRESCGVDHLNHVIRGTLNGAATLTNINIASLIQCAACGDAGALMTILSDESNLIGVSAAGYTGIVEKFICNGANITYRDSDGRTCLMKAATGGIYKDIYISELIYIYLTLNLMHIVTKSISCIYI